MTLWCYRRIRQYSVSGWIGGLGVGGEHGEVSQVSDIDLSSDAWTAAAAGRFATHARDRAPLRQCEAPPSCGHHRARLARVHGGTDDRRLIYVCCSLAGVCLPLQRDCSVVLRRVFKAGGKDGGWGRGYSCCFFNSMTHKHAHRHMNTRSPTLRLLHRDKGWGWCCEVEKPQVGRR